MFTATDTEATRTTMFALLASGSAATPGARMGFAAYLGYLAEGLGADLAMSQAVRSLDLAWQDQAVQGFHALADAA